MVSNYLQRIAIAGSRAGAAAKPAVIGPPQMPGSVWSLGRSSPAERPLPRTVEGEQRQSRPSLDLAQARPVGFDPEVQRAVDAKRRSEAERAPDIEPTSPGESIVAGRSATSGVQEGTPLRPVAPEEPRAAIQSVLRSDNEAVMTAPKGLRPVPKPPPPAADELAVRLPAHDEADRLATQAEIRSALRPRTESVIFAPQGLRPVFDPAPAAANEPTVPLPSDAESRLLSAESPIPAQVGIERRSEAPNGDGSGQARLRSPATAEAIASDDLERAGPPVPSPHPRPERVGTATPTSHPAAPPAQVAVAAATQPAFIPKSHRLPVMPPNPALSTTNESRITIGRVEVQVNNRWPQVPFVSSPEPVRVLRSASALLEAHYLDRFSLRP